MFVCFCSEPLTCTGSPFPPSLLLSFSPSLLLSVSLPPLILSPSYVQATEICAEGDWSTGLRLLQVCRVALLHHPAPLLYKPLGGLLRFVATFYSDVCSYLCSYLHGLFGQARVYSVSTAVPLFLPLFRDILTSQP